MRFISILFLSSFLFGCMTPDFVVKKTDDRFEEPAFYAQGNRISTKSVDGGVHIDGKGLFINPHYYVKSKLLGFTIVNDASNSTLYGKVNSLGRITKLVFNTDGEKITLKPISADSKFGRVSYNSISMSAGYNIKEIAVVVITRSKYKKIINAKKLAVYISGTDGSAIYEDKDITASFKANLRKFFEKYVS